MKKSLASFLYEVATLKRLQRTGWQIIGSNKESIAEHSYMVAVISFILAKIMGGNLEKVLTMALFHDLEETRTGDIYKLADFYTHANSDKALKDSLSQVPDQENIFSVMDEYSGRKSPEAKIVHDADVLALCLELKQMIEQGNFHAGEWFRYNRQRLVLPQSKKLMKEIEQTDSQDWWKKERDKIHTGK